MDKDGVLKTLSMPGDEGEWHQFLLDEGLEALAAYRSIRNADVRAMFIRLMRDSAQAERAADPDLN